MDLSIIVCCYLQEEYVDEAVASAKNQQFKGSFEVIEHHDHCSTNGGTGASNARNLAISHAKGKRILLLDADDRLPVNYAQALWDEMELWHTTHCKLGLFAACPTQFISGPTLARFGLAGPGLYRFDTLEYGIPITASAMFDKSAWEEVKGFSPDYLALEDTEFWCRLLAAGYRCAYTEKTCLLKHNPVNSKSHQQVGLREKDAARLKNLYGIECSVDII